jgi:hypothetical protein
MPCGYEGGDLLIVFTARDVLGWVMLAFMALVGGFVLVEVWIKERRKKGEKRGKNNDIR